MFGKIIGAFFSIWPLVYVKIALLYSVLNSIVSHIKCFNPSLLYGIIHDTGSALVVCLDQSWRLQVA